VFVLGGTDLEEHFGHSYCFRDKVRYLGVKEERRKGIERRFICAISEVPFSADMIHS